MEERKLEQGSTEVTKVKGGTELNQLPTNKMATEVETEVALSELEGSGHSGAAKSTTRKRKNFFRREDPSEEKSRRPRGKF